MRLYLMDNKRITKYNLPSKVEEYFLFTYKDTVTNLDYTISLELKNNAWVLKSNGSVSIMDGNNYLEEAVMREYSFTYLKLVGQNKFIIMFALPTQENELYKLNYHTLQKITIGNSASCNINYQNAITSELHATLEMSQDGNWYIKEGTELKSFVYVNNKKVTNAKLKCGDIIFINGFKIIWMKEYMEINNPNKAVTVTGIAAYEQYKGANNAVEAVSDEEATVDLYKDDDYFYHVPRIMGKVVTETVLIDAPPAKQSVEELPFLLSLGTSLTMLASAFVTGFNLYKNIKDGQSTLELIPQYVMFFSLLFGSIIMPKVLDWYNKRRLKKIEKKRQKKYTAYLNTKEEQIKEILKRQAQIMNDNNESALKCYENVTTKKTNIWGRELTDADFLTVRLGVGNVPANLMISAPEEHFTMEVDNLFENVYRVVDDSRLLKNVPITYSFLKNKLSSIVFNCSYKENYIKNLMIQLLTFHSGSDLKIVIFTEEGNVAKWDYLKTLPHNFSDDKSIRFFGTSFEEYNEISNYLIEEFKKRKDFVGPKEKNTSEEVKVDKKDIYKNFDNYYLIITDCYRKSKNIQIMETLLKEKENFGFSILAMANTMKNLPNNCENFIQIGETSSTILNKEVSIDSQQTFTNEKIEGLDMDKFSSCIANIPLMPKDGLSVLPTSLSFLDMFKVSRIEQLNILNRWQTNNPVKSISTTIGVHANGEPFKLDLHEKFHGPHGLIAGSTGSGKSEFIITYILSLALNYHPYEVQFVLIDYKGGGLAGAFENKETGVVLPHLVGTITNLDVAEMNRTLVSIESELKRRQQVFNDVKDSLGESTIDIYKYQKLYRDGLVKEPMAHLFIISDEFAELKAQQPDFMSSLISTARIGRSLGIHLILATQKPSGVVNDQIWSNSKFKVCLKVQDRGDSMEMLKKPDAASIKDVGRFYLQVGYDDYFDIGQSGWGGAKYVPSNKIIKKVDDSINFINNVGNVVKSINDAIKKDEKEQENDMGDQLTNIVKHIYALGVKENIRTKNLWLDKIPDEIFLNDLKTKYNYQPVQYKITPVIGEYDNPTEQKQGLLTLDLTNKGNTVIFGQSGSGKENLLATIIWSIMAEHTPDEVNIYAIDCGAETLKMFYNIPHVGEIVNSEESEKIQNIFEMVSEEIEKRKDLFADYAGSYLNYIENSGQKLPLIVVILNNYEMFEETYSRLSDDVMPLYRDCQKYGIVFIITATTTSSIRSRMQQNFENKISLQLPDESDYSVVIPKAPRKLTPVKNFGRGLVGMADTAYEFQTANICELRNLNNSIKAAAEKLNGYYKTKAKKIVTIPNQVLLSQVKDEIGGINKIPIGYSLETKQVLNYNFSEQKITKILSNDMSKDLGTVYSIIRSFAFANVDVVVVDFVGAIRMEEKNITLYNNNFDKAFLDISGRMANEKNSNNNTMYVFVGIGEFKSKLSNDGIVIANNIFMNSHVLEKSNILLVDEYGSFKRLVSETWYQTQLDNTSGIWLGEGLGSQMAMNVSNFTVEERKISFPYMGFVIKNSKKTIIKAVIDDLGGM